MKEKNQKRTLREDWNLLCRGIRIAMGLCPQFLGYDTANNIMNFLPAYFSLYMSSRLVNELAGKCRWESLLILAGITVAGLFALKCIRRAVEVRRNIWLDLIVRQEEIYMFDKQHGLEYEHLENPEVTLLREKIFAIMDASGNGLMRIFWGFGTLMGDMADLILSASLTFSIFRTAADRELTGFLAFVNSPYCNVLLVGILLVHVALSMHFSKEVMRKSMKAVEGLAESNVFLQVMFNMHGEDITIFNLKKFMMKEHERRVKAPWIMEMDRIGVHYTVIDAVRELFPGLAVFLVTAAKAFLGVFGIGNFILYRGTVERFVNAFSGVAKGVASLRENNECLLELYRFLDLPDDMYQGTLAVEKRDDIDYEIEFRDVSFRYPGTETWVLRHVDMKFRIGDKLAIVGENGSGKTTFIKLLCRLYDPTEGEILLNGINIRKYNYREYLSIFSVVFQDFQLLAMELGKNVAAGDRADRRWGLLVSDRNKRPGRMEGNGRETEGDYDREKAAECLEKAGLSQWLSARPGGLDTILYKDLDEKGVQISGGEAQKIAIARSLYRDAPFMILDEPTAALDPVAEYEIYTRLNEIVGDKTAIYISHRLSSCRFCDEIIVFHEGSIVQRGSHERLLAEGEGKYKELWNAQAQYYVREQKKRRQKGS